MRSLENERAIVTGGSSGLGLGLVEALVERKARVWVIGRDAGRLAELERRFGGSGVSVVKGDATDPMLCRSLLADVRPSVLALLAGTTPEMAPIHEQSWEAFSAVWNNDVKSAFHWIKEAISLPLAPGSSVLIGSSGAAIGGSPLSGGYAGAKRMLWWMARYATGVSKELDLKIRFQALAPQQIVGDTPLGRRAAEAYARQRGVTLEAFLASFGKPLPPRLFGEHAVAILTDPKYDSGTVFGLKGDTGIQSLDG